MSKIIGELFNNPHMYLMMLAMDKHVFSSEGYANETSFPYFGNILFLKDVDSLVDLSLPFRLPRLFCVEVSGEETQVSYGTFSCLSANAPFKDENAFFSISIDRDSYLTVRKKGEFCESVRLFFHRYF